MNIFEGNNEISHSCVALELYIYIYIVDKVTNDMEI